jgi:hypothetical protein
MKQCPKCEREDHEELAVCPECGTEFSGVKLAPNPATISRRRRIFAVFVVFLVLGIAVIAAPKAVLAVPFLAFFVSPLYVPFLLSLAIKAPEWRGLKWSLRVGSVLALLIYFYGVSHHAIFGDDVAGSIAGAIHNFKWTWGSGIGCATAAFFIGLLLRLRSPAHTGARPMRVSLKE